MGKETPKTISYTLTSEEVEKMLLAAHGNKLQPVSNAKMAQQRRVQEYRWDKSAEKQSKSENGGNNEEPES